MNLDGILARHVFHSKSMAKSNKKKGAKKKKKLVVNPLKWPVPNRNPKKGDRVKYQWDRTGKSYELGLVLRGGKTDMKVLWDVDKKELTVPVADKEGWWFFESGNAARKRAKAKTWKPPPVVTNKSGETTRRMPKFQNSSIEAAPPKGKHLCIEFYPRHHFKFGGPGKDGGCSNCLDRLGLIFAQHVKFTKKCKNKKLTGKHFCRGQRVELDRFHEAFPPANTSAVILWLKLAVQPNVDNEWGGEPLDIPSAIICHFDKTLANSMTIMPIYEVDLEEIVSVERGLLTEFDNNRGLVEALQIKFNLFCKIFDPVNNSHSHIIPFVFVEARASDVCFCFV